MKRYSFILKLSICCSIRNASGLDERADLLILSSTCKSRTVVCNPLCATLFVSLFSFYCLFTFGHKEEVDSSPTNGLTYFAIVFELIPFSNYEQVTVLVSLLLAVDVLFLYFPISPLHQSLSLFQ